MKIIPLTKGRVALVDDEDFELLNQWSWCINKDGQWPYAIRRQRNAIPNTIVMHRLLMGFPQGMEIDHIDGNTLNNQKSNLRICSSRQNKQNRRMTTRNSSGYKGVFYAIHPHNRWRAVISINGKTKHLGHFLDPRMAAMSYDEAAIKHFGEFAKTNKQLGLL